MERKKSKINNMVFLLETDALRFPDPSLAEEDGLLAVGGDLSPERLMLAYSMGIFPWFAEEEPICWYSPHSRCVIFPDQLVISKSMNKIITRNTFDIRTNTAFTDVMKKCKTIPRKGQEGTWISDEMIKAYVRLHDAGKAHSIEVWQSGELVGGLYGVVINNVFCGESMFSEVSNTSKAALAWLCRKGKYKLIDCQIPNPHLMSMGAVMIERKDYMAILNNTK